MATLIGNTTNFNFGLINFDIATWHDAEYDNWRSLDAILGAYIGSSNMKGLWTVSTLYGIGDIAVDGVLGSLWNCDVSHTSAASGAFSADRSANPTYWSVASTSVSTAAAAADAAKAKTSREVAQAAQGASMMHEGNAGTSATAAAASAATAAALAVKAQIGLQAVGLSQYLAANMGLGVLQQVHTADAAVATGTTVMPSDDTIPQITEGDEYLTQAITPKATTNRLFIETVVYFSSSTGANSDLVIALFQDATAGALAAGGATIRSNDDIVILTLQHEMAAGTVSATTFRVRCGSPSAGTNTFNGSGAARLFGGVMGSYIRVTEFE